SMTAAAVVTAFTDRALAREKAAEPPLGFVADPRFIQQAKLLLAEHPAIDLHAHPGDTFVRGARGLAPALQAMIGSSPSEQRAVTDMQVAGMAGGSFAAVADLEILGMREGKLGPVREFRPGEARSSYERQIANLREWVPKAGAVVALTPDDIVRSHQDSHIAALLTVEGGGFLAGHAS